MGSWKKEGKEGGAIRNGREEEIIRNRGKELYVGICGKRRTGKRRKNEWSNEEKKEDEEEE